MQIVNNYDEAVINGDIGYVVASDAKDVLVEFDDPALELAVAAGRFRGRQQSADGSPMPLLPYEQEAVSTPAQALWSGWLLSGVCVCVWYAGDSSCREVQQVGSSTTVATGIRYDGAQSARQRMASGGGGCPPVTLRHAHTRLVVHRVVSSSKLVCRRSHSKGAYLRVCMCVAVWLCLRVRLCGRGHGCGCACSPYL